MSNDPSFGDWLRQRRRALDLTQAQLARQVCCSAITLRKLEAEERRPSKQIAERLADVLQVAVDDRPAFLRFARGDPFAAPAASRAGGPTEPNYKPLHNLPFQLTSFIGRETEIAEVSRLLSKPASARLLTLTGAGGTGKTRLALEAAVGVVDTFADGVWLIELARLADPALVPQTVAAVLGLREVPGQPLIELLIDQLRRKQLLLVLDNCEHLIEACAQLSESLLRACPQLAILATSRESLGIAGESTYPVPSLSLPGPNEVNSIEPITQSEAARLFVERAMAVWPGFTLTNDNAAAVAQICRQLDGIPLAIELAAARVKALPVERIAVRLAQHDRFRLLIGGSRTALPRHQTLPALIDWSYDLLTEAEQVLLQRLAVFMGGWPLEAAEAVGAGEGTESGDVLDRLNQLANKSLVVMEHKPGAEPRYRLLETIRQYALAKLTASGEADWVRRQHAAYYLALWQTNSALNFYGTPPRAWIDRAEMELDNLRAALAWSQSPGGDAGLGLHLTATVPSLLVGYTELRGWLEAALARAELDQVDHRQARALALRRLGQLVVQQADFASARAHLTQSLMLFQEMGDSLRCASALERLGWLAREQGDTTTARLRLAESLTLFRELGDKIGLAHTLNTLGEVAVMQSDTVVAAELLKEALALNRELGNTQAIGWSLNHLGHVAQIQGEYELAIQLHEESLSLFRKIHHNYIGVGEANHSLGQTALARGDAPLATKHFREALNLFRFHAARAQVAWCLAGLAGAAVLDDEPQRAARLWGAAEALRQSIGARQASAARATRERLMAAARKHLGETAFEAAWAEGQAMTFDKALALALETKVGS